LFDPGGCAVQELRFPGRCSPSAVGLWLDCYERCPDDASYPVSRRRTIGVMQSIQTFDRQWTSLRSRRVHRAWWIVAIAAVAIIVPGAFSTMPGLLVDPLHGEFGWSHGSIGLAVWVNMAINGLIAPFSAALMDRFGVRRVAACALALIVVGAASTTVMNAVWQLVLCWGLLIGVGTGSLAMTFAAVVTSRWFVRRRALAAGILTAASVFGQFVFMPVLAWIIAAYHWRAGTMTVIVLAVAILPFVWLFLRDHPADVGVVAFGAGEFTPKPAPEPGAARRAFMVLRTAAGHGTFWLLTATFAICGISTNGVMWSMFVPAAGDHGMPAPMAASLLTLIGTFNVAGTIVSGWLTDHFDPRLLLSLYYFLRGGTLILFPVVLGPTAQWPLICVVILFGVLDVATVPPTIGLSSIRDTFGSADTAVVFGWALTAHQVGAGLMAFFGGNVRDMLGSYTAVWIVAALFSALASVLALFIRTARRSKRLTGTRNPEGSPVGAG
jgi:predicted MFS family arabinose efflux permease